MFRESASAHRGSPVVLALFVSSAFTAATNWLRTENEIILPEDGESIDRQRGHAVVAVGHGRFDSEDLILVRNSWGPVLGGGWARLVPGNIYEPPLFGGLA